jgi:hypothetical protein
MRRETEERGRYGGREGERKRVIKRKERECV